MSVQWRFRDVARDMKSATTMEPPPCHSDTGIELITIQEKEKFYVVYFLR